MGFYFADEMTYPEILAWIIEAEGGYVLTDTIGDKGGLTYAGMTRGTFNQWRESLGDPGLTEDEFSTQSATGGLDADVRIAYEDLFATPWRTWIGFSEDFGLMLIAIDASVLSGQHAAVTMLQRACGDFGKAVTVDGLLGPNTLAAVNRCLLQPTLLLERFSQHRAEHYTKIVESDASQAKFIHGWTARVFAGLDAALLENTASE